MRADPELTNISGVSRLRFRQCVGTALEQGAVRVGIMRRRFRKSSEKMAEGTNRESSELVVCPYCEHSTRVREDRLEAHVRKQHPDRRPRPGVPLSKASTPRPTPLEPSRRPAASRADVEALERVARLIVEDDRASARSAEGAAVQSRLGYLAKVGKRLLPKAFALVDQSVMFTGDGPYDAYRLQ